MDFKVKPAASTQTTCPYCGVGCGVAATLSGVAGDQSHPANQGRLCVKGSALHETLGASGRLLKPRIAGEERSWPEALAKVSGAIRNAITQYGPGSVAFYLSGQLLTEDYYVANKLAKGFIGTPHVDTNSRLCMSSAVAAHKRAFGEDCVPGCYDDLELADLLVLAGSNAAWAHPVLYQRMQASQRAGRRVVVIDPRRTATAELADLHLKLKPGTDTVLFNGLLVWLAQHNAIDRNYIAEHCTGFGDTLVCAQGVAPSLASVAAQCDLDEADIERFYCWYAETPRTVTAFSQGINQAVNGTDKCNAIINSHLATGRVGRPGAGPFSLTGQPNAMGGREAGGLANTLAAHMNYDTPGAREQLAGFWGTDCLPETPGLNAVDLFEAVHRGDIKVLWIMGTNPAVSLPDSGRVCEALKACPTVIVSDCMADTDTTALADILLPAAGWGEKDGTVTNSERCISRQRAFLPLPAEVRPDWWILTSVARALGYVTGFQYRSPADVFREHAAVSALACRASHGRQVFDIGALAQLTDTEYDQFEPTQWPIVLDDNGVVTGTRRLFSGGRFATNSGRARLVPIPPGLPRQAVSSRYPFVVNTGRIRDQWHTMTRTALASRLLAHRQEPFVEIHPDDAHCRGVREGALCQLTGPGAEPFVGRARITSDQRPGELFIPIHWSGRFASQGIATNLIAAATDPISGQPESKHGVASLGRYTNRWQARLMRRNPCDHLPPLADLCDYWCRQPLAHSTSWWLAGSETADWRGVANTWLAGEPQLMLVDSAQGRFRAARVVEGRLDAVLLVDTDADLLPGLDWLDQCFAADQLSPDQRLCLLAGRSVETEEVGALVCSCYQVGDRQIVRAIREGQATVEALGHTLRCGTNCGSCVPEIRNLLQNEHSDTGQVH